MNVGISVGTSMSMIYDVDLWFNDLIAHHRKWLNYNVFYN